MDYLYPYSKGEYFKGTGEGTGGNFSPDVLMRVDDESPLFCLLVARLQHEDNDCEDLVDLGIVLTPVDLEKWWFRRVGFYTEGAWSTGKGRRMFRERMPEITIEII